ncbi:ECF RNA polymerase sigma factor SigW [Aquisphaera giovannonii]|uniref:ECF RNA polymerase sigma factor SigW n=1 Tax=Aquisphaera giovannonii TaxID=406548 RepID=A0A5B9W5C0_9BACT|nr:sigma-70 family RNA polymerase sigma factor [Aquisphaera giovannonii]QEH35773.1 ECF RNA polymerase sigma factor SigW [Aquisphaera giovannonii]
MDDEHSLIRAMARRDRAAWGVMYDRHVGDVFGLCHHLLGGDPAAAEEVCQEAWLIAIEGFDRFDGRRGRFRDWLLGIARHRAIRHRRRLAGLAPDDGAGECSGELAPPDRLESLERADAVRAALVSLEGDRRGVLLDKYVHGLSVAEIAAKSGKSDKAVESLLSRARAQLRALLRPYFSNPTEGEHHESNRTRPAR